MLHSESTLGVPSDGHGYALNMSSFRNPTPPFLSFKLLRSLEGMEALADALRCNASLRELQLSNCGLCDQALKLLADGLLHGQNRWMALTPVFCCGRPPIHFAFHCVLETVLRRVCWPIMGGGRATRQDQA